MFLLLLCLSPTDIFFAFDSAAVCDLQSFLNARARAQTPFSFLLDVVLLLVAVFIVSCEIVSISMRHKREGTLLHPEQNSFAKFTVDARCISWEPAAPSAAGPANTV